MEKHTVPGSASPSVSIPKSGGRNAHCACALNIAVESMPGGLRWRAKRCISGLVVFSRGIVGTVVWSLTGPGRNLREVVGKWPQNPSALRGSGRRVLRSLFLSKRVSSRLPGADLEGSLRSSPLSAPAWFQERVLSYKGFGGDESIF